MPIYTFVCPRRGKKITDNFPLSLADGKKVICPKCQTQGLKRIFEQFFLSKKPPCSTCSSAVCSLCSAGGKK